MVPIPKKSKTIWREELQFNNIIIITHLLSILIEQHFVTLLYKIISIIFRQKMPRSRSRSASRSRSRSGGRYRSRTRSRSPSYRRKREAHSRSPMSNRRRHEGNRDAPQANTCLGVFGLSLYTTER